MENLKELVMGSLEILNTHYWRPIRLVLENKKDLKRTFPNFLISPEKIHLYMGHSFYGCPLFDT
jgi:hypothetical protein